MSKPRPNLDNSKKAAEQYVRWLKSIPFVESVYLAGSRARGKEKDHSDWDLVVFGTRRFQLPDPRKQFKFNCDVSVRTDKNHLRDFYKKI